MTTKEEKSQAVVKTVLSDGELTFLLNAAGVRPEKTSPLAQIGKPAAPDTGRKLPQTGLVDSSGHPTADCLEALNILANPGTEIDLLWGNQQGVSLSKTYSAAGKDRLVSFTRMNGVNNISYFLSPQDITDLVAQKLVFSEIKEIAELSLETGAAAVPVFFALLDLYQEAQLKATLERQQEFEVKIAPDEANRILQTAKVDQDLTWYAPVGYMAMPTNVAVTESVVKDGISALKRAGIIEASGVLSDSMAAFASRAFPLMAFFGINVYTRSGGAIEKAPLALFRGCSTLLFVQITSEGGRTGQAIINSISTSELPEILFNLAVRPYEVAAPPVMPSTAAPTAGSVVCGKCGTQNLVNAKFCTKCGATIAAPAKSKFCPKCGDPVTAGEKFCNKCGTKLA